MKQYYTLILSSCSKTFSSVKVLLLLIFMMGAVEAAQAQGSKDFNPEQFDRDLEAYVIKAAGLTAKEKASFLPVYREMRAKERAVFDKARLKRHPDFESEEECAQAIREHDRNDVKLKQIQKSYHSRFLSMLPAKKVLKIIRAEEDFHRDALKRFGGMKKKK